MIAARHSDPARAVHEPVVVLLPGEPGSTPDAAMMGDSDADEIRMTVFVRGRVQGVGFRWWTRARALELGLVGHARNTDDGRVEVVAQGARGDCAQLVRLLEEQPSTAYRPGRVVNVSTPLLAEPRAGIVGFVER